ncbi:MAG: SpoIID/LytB domain-containing protein [Proteobacteria bacterium]|nr:SpoIID/LytB domain-containing protein [Pseudomonadota bacterium]MBU4260086.1 SpoIID/LytB domain-containing protein [Pseudomonadota bacterium]MBU4289165.1 SpoIID/LytB domain-containing protein [Pseudomonadota bacterium]MBU4414707.1 SpoIID/LytB domain-containing protein [Pseudomonadota bacterium]MCG2757647.1 SpoIID/LytB domain-containing protein [Desulfobacteraceae bacterium]
MLRKPALNLFLGLLCLFFLCMEKAAVGAYNDAQGFKTAAEFLNRGMYLEAVGTYQEIAVYSDNFNNRAQALLFMGTTYSLYLDQYDAALKEFENVMKVYPGSPAAEDALLNSGMVLYEKGEFKKAYEFFKQYMAKYPNGMRIQSAEVWADSSKSQTDTVKTETPPVYKTHIADTTIRVLIKERAEKITVNSEKNITVSGSFSGKRVYYGSGPVTFTKKENCIVVNGRKSNSELCRVESDGTTVTLDSRRCRGFFTISTDSEGLCAINHIPVEEYLYGVVPKEMPYNWAKEALMAQAVAARTYALYIKDKSADKHYDVEATTASQVYGGYDVETPESNLAVDETRGQVITYDGRLIVAYFHSNSGGHTEDSKNVWTADLPYLKGISDSFSANIPNGEWSFFVSYNDMQNRLNKYGLNIGKIKKLNPAGESRSGRTLKVIVVSDKGTSELTSNNFRIKIGATSLKSALFQIKPDAHGVRLKGKGYGHGVGMSQWGANMMAQKGFDYQDILRHYYQSVKIVALSSQ